VSISRADVNWNESASDLWRRILDTRQFFVNPQDWDEEVGSKKLWRVSDLWRMECAITLARSLQAQGHIARSMAPSPFMRKANKFSGDWHVYSA
jgi:hypothetical protein